MVFVLPCDKPTPFCDQRSIYVIDEDSSLANFSAQHHCIHFKIVNSSSWFKVANDVLINQCDKKGKTVLRIFATIEKLNILLMCNDETNSDALFISIIWNNDLNHINP